MIPKIKPLQTTNIMCQLIHSSRCQSNRYNFTLIQANILKVNSFSQQMRVVGGNYGKHSIGTTFDIVGSATSRS